MLFLGAFAKLRKATISFVMSVRPSAWNNSTPTGRIFLKFEICVLFENRLGKFRFHQNLTRITGTIRADQYTFLIISRSILLRMRNVSDKSCREYQNTHFVSSSSFLDNGTVYEIMWKNTIESERQQMTIRRMRIACWIPKATNTESDYV